MDSNYKIANIYIPTNNFSLDQAKTFLSHHKYKIKNIENSDGYYKFQQVSPKALKKYGFTEYTAKEIGSTGVVMILVSRCLEEGGDFKNYISEKFNQTKDFILSGSQKFSVKVKAILSKYGNEKIHTITIIRAPLNSMIKFAIESLSWNKIEYDKLFHLSLIFNGNILIEKNSIISMTVNPNISTESEVISFEFKENSTINQFIQNALVYMGGQKFFTYSAYDNNCQYFLLNLLQSNGIANTELTNFIKQDTESIFATNPTLRILSNNVTDVHGRTTEVLGGKIKIQ
jgi:hypothetical protein